jgi:hypothetical protein
MRFDYSVTFPAGHADKNHADKDKDGLSRPYLSI